MAQQLINVGTSANDNTGDTLRDAFQKVNANVTDLLLSIRTSADSTFNGITIGKGGGGTSASTYIGYGTGVSNTTGNSNTSIGYASLNQNTIGGNNSAFGVNSLLHSISGSFNTALGTNSIVNNTTGSNNSSIGHDSLYSNTIGGENVALGRASLYQNLGASSNTAIGYQSGFSNISFFNISCLGANSNVTNSNQIQLGDSATTTYVYGTVQNRSDLRDKADVQDTVLGLDFICQLRPVDYKWDMREDYKSEMPIQGELSDEDFKIQMDLWLENNKLSNLTHDGSKKRNRLHHGLIAQEVRDLGINFGGFQDHSISGGEDVLSIGYDEFIAPMIKAIQELKAEIEILKAK